MSGTVNVDKIISWNWVENTPEVDITSALDTRIEEIVRALIQEIPSDKELINKLMRCVVNRSLANHRLCSTDRKSILLFLRKFYSEINQITNCQYLLSFYFQAVCNGDLKLAKHLLYSMIPEQCFDNEYHEEQEIKTIADSRSSDEKKLMYICSLSDIKELRLLIDKGANVNSFDPFTGITPLMMACFKNEIEVVKLLIEKGADVNAFKNDGNTSLIIASIYGHLDIIKLLIQNNALIDEENIYGNTPLIKACECGHLEVAQFLIEKKANITKTNKVNSFPLMLACVNGYTEIVKLLLKNGVDVDSRYKEKKQTPLMVACENNDIETMQILIENKADLNASDVDGYTVTSIACSNGHHEALELLIKSGAHLDKENPNILFDACKLGHAKVVQVLLENGFSPDGGINTKGLPLILAIEGGHLEVILELLKFNVNCNIQFQLDTPLSVACRIGYLDVAALLIEHGADINYCDDNGYSSLINIWQDCDINTIQFLIENKYDLNSKNELDYTPLMFASARGDLEIVKLLLENGADKNAIDKEGITPFLFALNSSSSTAEEVALYLLDSGANFEVQFSQSISPLITACQHCFEYLGKELLKKGINVNSKDKKGMTAIYYALKNGLSSFVSLLLRYDCDLSTIDEGLKIGLLIDSLNRKIYDDHFNIIKDTIIKYLPDSIAKSLVQAQTLSQYEAILCNKVKDYLQTMDHPLEYASLLGSKRLWNALKSIMKKNEFHEHLLLENLFAAFAFHVNPKVFSKGSTLEIDIKKILANEEEKECNDWDINNLFKMFRSINFYDPKKPYYRDPAKLKNHGVNTSPDTLESGILTLLDRIDKKTALTGTPPAGSERLENYYLDLIALLKRIGIALEKLDPDERATYIIDLAVAGLYCGNAVVEAYRMHTVLNGKLPKGLMEMVYSDLMMVREGIITDWAIKEGAESLQTHRYNQYMFLLGRYLNLPYADEDIFSHPDPISGIDLTQEEAVQKFHEQYDVHFLLDFVTKTLWSIYKDNRDEVINWFEDNTPPFWKRDYYDKLFASVKDMSRAEAQKYLMIKGIALDPLILDTKEAINKHRSIDYLHECVFNFNEEGEPISLKEQAIRHFMLKAELLSVL